MLSQPRQSASVISSLTLLALVFALLAAAPASQGPTALPAPATTVDPVLEAELLTASGAVGTAIVAAHEVDGLAAIEAVGVTGARLEALSMLVVEGLTATQFATLRGMDEVRSIWGQEELELHMQESTWVTGARDVWEREEYGYTGEGVELGVVDTGADGTHADFGNLIEFCNASATGTLGLVLCTEEAALAVDDNGHGTHVAGTMAGTGAASGGMEDPHSTIGMAPNAKIRSYAANVAASLLNTDVLAAYDDLIAKREAGENHIVAINNSFGGSIGADYNPDDPQLIAFQKANEVGMLPVFSAGNSGPDDNTLGVQCLSPYVLCVGASTKTDGITAFSSVGRPAAPHPETEDDDPAAEIDGGNDPDEPAEEDSTDDEATDELIEYDNHDRRLARAFDLGVYRPGIVAPGAVINAMMANAPCKAGMPVQESCYEELQGTSMSAPHVTGAAALVTEAFRDAHDRDPSADELLHILEASAAPLPGHPAEQQGAGRLDVPAAIDLALAYDGEEGAEPDWVPVGTPTPNYVEGKHPGGDTLIAEQTGCTGVGSFTLPEEAAVTTFEVPAGAGELTVDVEWGDYHPDANLYLELFRPGHDPANSTDEPGPTRTYPVAESAGLVHTDAIIDDVGPPATSRSVSFAAPEDGEWSLRVAHRLGATVQPCHGDDNTPETARAEGFSYDVAVHVTEVTDLPEAALWRDGDGDAEDVVMLHGTASYPDALEGVTTWAPPGSRVAVDGDEDIELTDHYFDGDPTGLLTTEGTFTRDEPDGELPLMQTAATALAEPHSPYNPLAITWTGDFSGTLNDDLHLDWYWATPNLLGGLIEVEVLVTVFADPDPAGGEQPDAIIGEQQIRLQVLPEEAGPVRNQNRVFVRGDVEETLQIQVSPVFVDTGPAVTAFYGAASTPSRFGVPERDPADRLADVDAPQDLRVTDLQDRLRVAWEAVEGADGYAIHRSTDPAFTIGDGTLVGQTAGDACLAPNVPSWPEANHEGLCFVDDQVAQGTTHYYRVVPLEGATPGEASLLGYGTPTAPDRQARVQVDRIFGPGYWEDAEVADATATSFSHLWDLRGVDDPDDPRARVFSQGVGSLVADEGEPPVVEEPTDPIDPTDPTDVAVQEANVDDRPLLPVTGPAASTAPALLLLAFGAALARGGAHGRADARPRRRARG